MDTIDCPAVPDDPQHPELPNPLDATSAFKRSQRVGIALALFLGGGGVSRTKASTNHECAAVARQILRAPPVNAMQKMQIQVGDRVRVRQRSWLVDDVDSYEACRVLRLTRAGQGGPSTCRVIHPFDDVEREEWSRVPRRVSVRRWRAACRTLLASSGDAASLRTAAAARIELLPYQLEPALALLHGLGSRVLLADEVGLGKTVQAMLAIGELRARGAASRVLVVCPAGLREQWVDEAVTRFGIPLQLVDHTAVRRIRASVPADVNPWSISPLVVVSIDYVKRSDVLAAVLAAAWDIVVVDEAHSAGGDSDRRLAVARLCERAAYVLLLTATPHSGDEAAFTSLCALGQHDDRLVVFRRSRLEAGRDAGRRVHTLRVGLTPVERRMHAALAALTRAVRREWSDMDRHVWLMLLVLHKRALSSAHALAASAERRLALLTDGRDDGPNQLLLPLDDETGELDGADSAPMWSAPALHDVRRERRLLEAIVAAAQDAAGSEGKLRRLRRILARIDEPAIVFTEYRDTLLHLRNQVVPHATMIHGGMTRDQRRAALDAFPASGVLLATDAAGEGLNLQRHCRTVINLELPWNPMRLEQRIGRVDRIGQRRRVHVVHLISAQTGEVRLLERLSSRVAHADARVGAPNPLAGRPEWTEDSSARVVVLREAPAPRRTSPPPRDVPLTRLQQDAARESSRIAHVRALSVRSARPQQVEHVAARAAPLVAWTRRASTRRVLAGKILALARSTITDASGRVLASRLHGALSHAFVVRALTDPEPLVTVLTADDPEHERWSADSLRTHRQMTTVRLHRLRRIAAGLRTGREERQPGLFDRRHEHAWAALEHERQELLAHLEEEILRVETSLQTTVSSPDVVLVLVPRGRALGP